MDKKKWRSKLRNRTFNPSSSSSQPRSTPNTPTDPAASPSSLLSLSSGSQRSMTTLGVLARSKEQSQAAKSRPPTPASSQKNIIVKAPADPSLLSSGSQPRSTAYAVSAAGSHLAAVLAQSKGPSQAAKSRPPTPASPRKVTVKVPDISWHSNDSQPRYAVPQTPTLGVLARSKASSQAGKSRPPTPASPQKNITAKVPSLLSSSQSQSTTYAIPQTPKTPTLGVLPRSKEPSQPGKSRPPAPIPPQPRHSAQSSTSSANSRSKAPVQLPTLYRVSDPSPPTQSLTASGYRDAPPPVSQHEQSSLLQHILPLLAVLRDQQTTILTQNATADRTLNDLVAQVGRLSDDTKQKDEDTKKREAKDESKEEKEREHLKILSLLAQKVEDVRKRVVGIETVVGVNNGRDGEKKTIFDRLSDIEMDVGEWLERVRDPYAAAVALDQRGSIQLPTPSSLSPTAPTVVRHEMAVSPIKVTSTSRAVSTRTPEPAPEPTRVHVSTQVDTSDEPPTREVAETGSLCVSCSKKLHSPSLHSMNDVDMSDSTASVPSHSKGKEVERISTHQITDDDPFLSQPALATSDAPARIEETSNRSDRENASPAMSSADSPLEKLPIGSFSPVDWSKNPASSASAVDGSSSSTAVPSNATPTRRKSYTLPPLPEGTVAALRKSSLVDPYPYPLESAGLGEGDGLGLTMAGVVGASVEAAERMPSPESQCDAGNVDENDDNSGEQSTPKVCDTQHLDSKRSTSLSGSPTPEPKAIARHVAKSTEKSTPTQIMVAILQERASMSTESSLTSLTSNSSSIAEDSTTDNNGTASTRAPSPIQEQTSTAIATKLQAPLLQPASQTSNITEDEDTVMALVTDALPTSPAPPPSAPPETTTFSPVLISAPPLVLVSPEPGRSRPIDSPDRDDLGEKKNLMKLQEWYKDQRMKVLSTTTENDARTPGTDKPIPHPSSPMFTSPNMSPRAPAGPVDQTEDVDDDMPGGDNSNLDPPVSPLFSSPSLTPPKRDGQVDLVHPEHLPSDRKKLTEIVEDDDVEIIPLNPNRTSTRSARSLFSSKKGKEKAVIPSPSQPPPKRGQLGIQTKREPSKAKTRIKKRKVSQEPTTIEIDDSEEEEDQPPLKRVKLRLNSKAPASASASKNSSVGVAKSVKPKSVTVVSPMKTPMRRGRDQQPTRTARVVWPNIDKPVFDQFIECDICERWYHVGCVGMHPEDIRLSASEIYRCPPCDAGVSKEGKLLTQKNWPFKTNAATLLKSALTPVKNTQGNKQDEACARTKCLRPRRAQSIKKESTFTVESFVGMVKKSVGGRGIKLVYLVKWLGYGFEDATWEEETAMGLPNPGFFIEQFEDRAREEGLDLSLCNSEASLLRCAVEAGWTPNGLFIKQ